MPEERKIDDYLDYEERHQRELREQSEQGRKCKAALEVLKEFMTSQRQGVLEQLETKMFDGHEGIIDLVLYLRILRTFEATLKNYIDAGEIVEKELMEYGEQ